MPDSQIASYKAAFLESCMLAKVLTFGSFTLKSGRKSPYFFNAGSFHPAALLSAVSTAYAHTIINFLTANPSLPRPDVIFGPAYKGIPLACCTLLELHRLDAANWSAVSYAFNRKETKTHGEGGNLVGASLKGKNILVIDDVITAGTAMRETIDLVSREGGHITGFVVALDRMERMPSLQERQSCLNEPDQVGHRDNPSEIKMSAIGQIRQEYGVATASIVSMDDVIVLLQNRGQNEEQLQQMIQYRNRYHAVD